MIFWYMLILLDDMLILVENMLFFIYFLYLKRLGRIALSAGQEPRFSERLFSKRKTSCFLKSNDVLRKDNIFLKKVIRDKPESIGNGLTTSRPVYLYRPYPG